MNESSTIESNNNNNARKIDDWFHRVYQQHNEEGRYYHTSVHLKEMLDYIFILHTTNETITTSQYVPMVWATFFHDVVYNPQSNSNEKDSAILFQEFANDVALSAKLASDVVTMIHATEKHHIIPTDDPPTLRAQEYFLDIDMSVLGKKSHAYLAYASLIRKEYQFVEHDTYCSKRSEILQSFLGKTIYISKLFQITLEGQARKNLQLEIELLKQGVIPGTIK
jgi:predicted metal-dependent HD superfamily phosphohydrolase